MPRYPDLHQTFNLVPSLVEQLENYASGAFVDVYWEHTLKPAADLDPAERAFVVERMCERSDHPRARSHPRYLELARKREAQASRGWEACARAFTVDELPRPPDMVQPGLVRPPEPWRPTHFASW